MGAGLSLHGSLYGGLAARTTSGDWASLTAGGRWMQRLGGGWRLSTEAEASAFAVTAPSAYRAVTGEIRPEIGWSSGRVSLFLEGRAGAGRSEVEATRQTVAGPGPGGGFVTQEVATDLWYWGGGPGVRYRAGALTLEGSLAGFASATGDYGTAGAGVGGEAAGVGWRVDLRVWDSPGGSEVAGGIRVQVPLGSGWDVHASGARSRPDPLLGTRPSVGGALLLSRRLARLGDRGAVGAPVYRVVDEGEPPLVRFQLERPEAERVAVVGDFTDWRPVSMTRRDGLWVLERRVPPGTYHFGFRVDGEWFVPEDAPGRVSDDWGRENATLVVSSP